MKTALLVLTMALLCLAGTAGQSVEDFIFSAALDVSGQVVIACQMPDDAYIAEDALGLSWPAGVEPVLKEKTGLEEKDGECHFVNGSKVVYAFGRRPSPEERLTLEFQGCTASQCFMPQCVVLPFDGTFHRVESDSGQPEKTEKRGIEGYHVASEFSGYKAPADFLLWLKNGLNDTAEEENVFLRVARKHGLWIAALLLIPLGLMLNLTPCVLPLIPISLAIIGAQTGFSKETEGHKPRHSNGAILGALYGFAQTIVYGALGGVAVLTGGRFGAINESPWTNWFIAGVFFLFALAMFDVFNIDFTRFRPHRTGGAHSHWVTAMFMGAVSALMASACVAPVLLAVLVLTADLFAQGYYLVIALPWFLGLGLALPWPFLGAGIARCPRPGNWMITIKRIMGVLILLFGIYYAHLGFALRFSSRENVPLEGWNTSLDAIASSESRGPVFLYFSGKACKSCALLKHHTFHDSKCHAALEKILKIELNDDIEAGKMFDVRGYPTCILLMPDSPK